MSNPSDKPKVRLPKHISGCGDYGKAFLAGMQYQQEQIEKEKRLETLDGLTAFSQKIGMYELEKEND